MHANDRRAKEKEHAARGLIPDEARLFFARRPGEKKRGAGGVRRRSQNPPLVRAHRGVLEEREAQFFHKPRLKKRQEKIIK